MDQRTYVSVKSDSGYIALSCILIAFMCLIGNSANLMMTIFVLAICALFVNRTEYLLPAVLISSLLGDYFVALPGIGMSRLTVLCYIVFSLLRAKCGTKSGFVCLILSSLYCTLSAFFSITEEIKPAISMVLSFAMLYCMSFQKVTNKAAFVKCFIYGFGIFGFYLFFAVFTGRGTEYIGYRLTFFGTNSNGLAMCLAQIITFLFVAIYKKIDVSTTFLSVTISILLLYIIALTGSRSAIISLVLTCVLVVMVTTEKKQRARMVLFLLMLIVILFVGFSLLKKNAAEVFYRFSIDSVEANGGTGRFDIWAAVIKNVIPHNLIFGIGFGGGNAIIAMAPYVARALGVHNMYISLLMQVGIIGSIAFYLFWIRTYTVQKSIKRLDDFVLIPVFMIVAAFINGFGEEVFSERFLWFAAGMIYMSRYNMKYGIWRYDDATENIIYC